MSDPSRGADDDRAAATDTAGGFSVRRFGVEGPLLFTPRVHRDERGYFFELWRAEHYRSLGLDTRFVQVNVSRSSRGTLRGLHFQRAPNAQGKLVSVVRGSVLDVAVDLRAGSSTYGQHVKAVLDDESHDLLWVPRGFAHGFLALSETVDVVYQVDGAHAAPAEGGVRWDDPDLAIDWELGRLGGRALLTSPRDAAQPLLRDGFDPLEP